MKNNDLKLAIYNIRKRSILDVYKLNREKSQYSKAVIYAIKFDCYPFFDLDKFDINEVNLFNDYYAVKKEFLDKLYQFLDDLQSKSKLITYYDLEDSFCGTQKREEIIIALRYAFLNKRFIGTINIENANSPIEVKGIKSNVLDDFEY